MRQLVVALALVGCSLAMPQAASPTAFPRILSFQSFQEGADFGHSLFQEDGTTSGQKIGPDGLLYGFYSYLQAPDNNRVKIYYRAGRDVGYEVIGVEGIPEENLGNLRAHVGTTYVEPAPAPRPARPAPVRPAPTAAPTAAPAPVLRKRPEVVAPVIPVPPPTEAPALVIPESTPAPHRFDYPATLNLERTPTGFVSSLMAT
ncbi:uncharacterized protein LOC143020584 [Oratosquilla oratoria]|uniref:uncharacterized protein LOC143020584 n=1 Tax=Oratosquilla oratoria TaxID=337810 RepID=UPI003F76202B